MRTTTVLTAAGLCLLASNARAAAFSVTDGVGVDVTDADNFTPAKAAMLRAAGVSVVRTDFPSYVIDTSDDPLTWNYAPYEKFFTTCKNAGLRIWVILQHGGTYCPAADWGPCVSDCYDTSMFRSRFNNYVFNTVKHFTEKAIAEGYDPHFIWELWNEPNGDRFWPQRPLKFQVDSDGKLKRDSSGNTILMDYDQAAYNACNANELQLTDMIVDNSIEGFQTFRYAKASAHYRNLALGVSSDGVSSDGALQKIRDAATGPSGAFPSTIVGPGVAAPKERDDSTTYLLSCLSGMSCQGNGLLEQLFKRPDIIDGISAHFYRLTNPETVVNGGDDTLNPTSYYGDADHFTGLRGTIGNFPIYSGEWGYTETWSGITRQVQADYLQRMMLTNFSQDIPVSIWFEDQDTYDVYAGFNFGLFENYCGSNPSFCKAKCQSTPEACIQENCSGTPCSPSCTADGTPFCAGHPDECYQSNQGNLCYPYDSRRKELNWGNPKPSFYAMKTLTTTLEGSTVLYSDVSPDHPDHDFVMFRAPSEKLTLAIWNTEPTPTNFISQDWGTLLLNNTPLYLGVQALWQGGDHDNWAASKWADGRAWTNGWQARFDRPTQIELGGERVISGLQLNAGSIEINGAAPGAKLRFTPGGGNIYACDPPACLDSNHGNYTIITAAIADAMDRGSDPLAFTNTPETFVLRKSGGGQVALRGNNTFHGTVLVGEGHIGLGSDQALGDFRNPVVLAGGGFAFEGNRSVKTGPLRVDPPLPGQANADLGNYWAVNTTSIYTFDSATINSDFSVSGGGNLELAGPLAAPAWYTLTKQHSGTLTLSTGIDNAGMNLVVNGGKVKLNKTTDLSNHAVGSIGGIASGATVQYTGSGEYQVWSGGEIKLNGGTLDFNGRNQQGTTMTVLDGSSSTLRNSFVGSPSTYTPSNPVSLNSGSTLNVDTTGDLTLKGMFTGRGQLTKSGKGRLSVEASSMEGVTTVNSGNLAFPAGTPKGGILINQDGALESSSSYKASAWLASEVISTSSWGSLALSYNESTSIDLTKYFNLHIGAARDTSITLSSLMKTLNGTYRFGGGGGTLTVTPSITGAVDVYGSGKVVLAGTVIDANTTIGGGAVAQFSLCAPGAGRISLNSGGTLLAITTAKAYKYGDVTNCTGGEVKSLSNWVSEIKDGALGTLALTADSGDAVNMSRLGFLYLGSDGNRTYTGTYSPSRGSDTYLFGGGGGTLTVAKQLVDYSASVPRHLKTRGNVVLTMENRYTGVTTVEAGSTLTLANSGATYGSINYSRSPIALSGSLFQNSSRDLDREISFVTSQSTFGGTRKYAHALDVGIGHLSPGIIGVNSVGTLTIDGDLSFTSNATLDFDLVTLNGYDRVTFAGTGRRLVLAGTLNITNTLSSQSGAYPIITNFGCNYTDNHLEFGDVPAGYAWSYAIEEQSNGTCSVVVHAVQRT